MRWEKMVPGARLELARPKGHQILSLARLPIPPPRQSELGECDIKVFLASFFVA